MILSLVLKLFGSKRSVQTEPVVTTPEQKQKPDREAVIENLLGLYEDFRAKTGNVVVPSEVERAWETTNKNKISVNTDGSYVMLNAEQQIVKTGDVLRRLKEYRHDVTGELSVKKFGVWNTVNGRLTECGTLVNRTNDGETHERLDGTLIYISVNSQSLIAHNELTGEEVALSLKGTVRHRYKKNGIDLFRLYNDGVVMTESQSLEESQTFTVKTMAEDLKLECVNRIERKFENGVLVCESYTFLDSRTGSQNVRLCLNLPTGELHLSKVQKMDNTFNNGVLIETSFDLSEPVSVSRDKEGNVSLIRGISKVRRFEMHENVCAVVFIDHSGDENLYFPAI